MVCSVFEFQVFMKSVKLEWCIVYSVFQVFMKSVKLEWCLGEINNAKKLLEDAVRHYPDFAKVRITVQH